MIQINLLPESYRAPRVSPMQQFHRSPLAIGVVAVLILVVAILFGVVQIRQAQLGHLQARLRDVQPKKQSVDDLNVSLQALRHEGEVLDRLMKERSRWAGYLNRLADITPDGVWYTGLSFDRAKSLTIQGAAIGRGGEEMARIGGLVEGLKADEALSAELKDIQIEGIKRRQDHEIEIIEFTITASAATGKAAQKQP